MPKPEKKTRTRAASAAPAESNKSGGEVITLTLKTIVGSFGSLRQLSEIALTGKVAYSVSKAFKKVQGEVDTYQESSAKIIKKFGGEPGPQGPQLNKKHPKYKEAGLALEKHTESILKTEVKMEGILKIDMQDLLDALPAKVVKGDANSPSGSDIVEDAPRIEGYILADLDWLIIPPTNW